jgi:hypothetical protein
LINGTLVIGPPKTHQSVRTVAVPPHIVPDLVAHIDRPIGGDVSSPVFTAEKGVPVRPHVLQKARVEARSSVSIGRIGRAHLHDCATRGHTSAAATGSRPRTLTAGEGHANPAAALRRQHATADPTRQSRPLYRN